MMARSAMRATYAAAAVVLLAGGFWGGKSLSTSTATPQVQTGTIGFVSQDAEEFTIRLSGMKQLTGYGLPATVLWQDAYGNWNQGTRPACMQPGTGGQHVRLGVVNAEPVAGAPGGPVIVWIECASQHVPRYPIVTPTASGPA